MLTDKLKNIGLIVLGVLLALALAFAAFSYWQKEQVRQNMEEARVVAQNRIAELSETIDEREGVWSHLVQEREVNLNELRQTNSRLVGLIQERDEQITTLTQAVANLRPIRVVVQAPTQTETEPGRIRVDFDETYEEFWRIHGYTMTNPPETQLNLEWTRPANFTVVTTQLPDLSWRSYIETDVPNLQIGEIRGTVNPISRPQEQIPWHHNIYIGVGGLVAVTGNSGAAYLDLGYDFGNFEIGILGGGVASPAGVDFTLGLGFRLNPFAL